MTHNNVKIKDAIRVGRKLRRLLYKKYTLLTKNVIGVKELKIYKKGISSLNSHIRVLKGLAPEWAIEIAELTFKDFGKRKVFWLKNYAYISGLKLNCPIL